MEPHTRLVALRKRLGIRQEAVADALRIPRPRVSTMEHGGKKLDDYGIVEVLAHVFGVGVEDLAAYMLKGTIDLDELMRRRVETRRPEPSNLDIAIAYLGDSISEAAVLRVREEASHVARDLPPVAWGKMLAKAQAALLAEVAEPEVTK